MWKILMTSTFQHHKYYSCQNLLLTKILEHTKYKSNFPSQHMFLMYTKDKRKFRKTTMKTQLRMAYMSYFQHNMHKSLEHRGHKQMHQLLKPFRMGKTCKLKTLLQQKSLVYMMCTFYCLQNLLGKIHLDNSLK